MKFLKILSKIFNFAVLPLTIVNGIFMLLGILCPFISPEKFVYLQFFGLAFPLFFLINVLFLFYWWMQLKITLLLPLCLFVFNLFFISKYVQISMNRTAPKEHIKISSLNCQSFGINGRNFFDTAINQFKIEAADILCLQEFYVNQGLDSHLETIKKRCGFSDYIFVPLKTQGKYGMVVFSKFQIFNQSRINFSDKTGNMAIYVDLLVNSDTVRVFNVHLQSNRFKKSDYQYVETLHGEINPSIDKSLGIINRMKLAYVKRARQADSVSVYVKKSPYPVLMAGDINDVPASYAYNKVAASLIDAFRERGNGLETTYIGKFPSFRIDYIFGSKNMFIYSYNSHQKIPSDHKMISAVFGLPAKKAN